MKLSVISSDKLAISLSLLCVVHCLGLPLLIIWLPSIAAMSLAQEAFHTWMVVAVIPISLFSLTLGCKKHKQRSVYWLGVTGLLTLVSAVLFGESHLGELGEKIVTLIGASLIAFAHVKNFKLCQQSKQCEDKCGE